MPVAPRQVQKNQVITVDVEDLAYGGLGVGRINGFVIFVKNGLPGDRVKARITRKKRSHAQAEIESLEKPSPHRIEEPPCPLFGTCGGCTWQNLPYDQQLHWKQRQVETTLKHLGGQHEFATRPIIGSPQQFRYRNKMEFSFGTDAESGRVTLGFHLPGRYDMILPVETCLLQPEPLDAMLPLLADYANRHGLTAYDQNTHQGFLRHAVIRYSHTTGESILTLLTTRGDLPEREALAQSLAQAVPGFKALLWGLNTGQADVARIESEQWVWGEPELIETVNGLTFRISPQSFFQTNTAGAEKLYSATVEMAQLGPRDIVFDAYCGTGSIGLHCAREAEKVVGVEVVTEAIWNARENAANNGIDNAIFIASPMARGLQLAQRAAGRSFSRVIIDPPRGGMDKRSLRGLMELRAPVFIYVSCNPATLARDLQTMSEAGYQIEEVQPVDLFPQTYHIETIVRMRRLDTSE